MGLRTLASGLLQSGAKVVYTVPTGRFATVNSIQIVNKAGSDCALDVVMRSAGAESHLTPSGFVLKANYKIEHDLPIGLNPGGYIKITCPIAGMTFVISGEERTSE
jgi:hypothetical protein